MVAQIDPVNVVSWASAAQSPAPQDEDGALTDAQAAVFANTSTLNAALIADVPGVTADNIHNLTSNDKIFAMRTYLEAGGVLS
jgi:hypothetical protein